MREADSIAAGISHMIRHVITVAALLSLLLCVAAGVLWVRSFRVEDDLQRSGSSGYFAASAARGRLSLSWDTEPYSSYWDGYGWQRGSVRPPSELELPAPERPLLVGSPAPVDHTYVDAMGFGLATHEFAVSGRRAHCLITPLWFPTVAFAVPPILLWRRRLRRPRPTNICPTCGYDLRASRTRCPECGASVSGKEEAVT